MAVIPINVASEYLLGGNLYSGHQLQRAIHCAHSVARAYEIADVENGGDGSVDWGDIDDAQKEAADAMGPLTMREVIAEACEFNDFASVRSQACPSGVEDAASLLTAAENAQACAEGWSLFTHFGERVEIRLERIDSPGEGDGALPDDAAAWLRVWACATPLHLRVIDILKASFPAKHARIEAYVNGRQVGHAHA